MANLQVKNVPEGLHRRLRLHASEQGETLRQVVLRAVRRELDLADFAARLRRREPVDLGRPAADTLAEVRGERADEHQAVPRP